MNVTAALNSRAHAARSRSRLHHVGKQQGDKNEVTTALRTGRTTKGHSNVGTAFVHTVIDDHSRLAYAEICADEKSVTAIGVLQRAVAYAASTPQELDTERNHLASSISTITTDPAQRSAANHPSPD